MRRTISLLLALLVIFPKGAVQADSSKQAVQELLDVAVTEGRIPAAVAFLAKGDELLWTVTTGSFDEGVPMRADAIMPLASVGKMFTATAAMILVEKGKLDLQAPVSAYIEGFPVDSGITVRHLLTHTTGFTVDGDAFWATWDEHVGSTTSTTSDFALDLAELPRKEPGSVFEYGQTGAAYEVLGAVIENASGQTLEEFMHGQIFEPLGLRDSSFYIPAELAYRLPAIYRMADGVLTLDRPQGEDFSRSTFLHGGGGVRTSARDAYSFARMLLNHGELDGTRLLQASTVERMMSDQLGELVPDRWRARGSSWGYGAAVRLAEDGSARQYGWVGGGFAKLFMDLQEGLIGFICVPMTPPGDNDLLREFEQVIYENYTTSD